MPVDRLHGYFHSPQTYKDIFRLPFHLLRYQRLAGTWFRYGTIRYHPWTSFPDLKTQETLPGSTSPPDPYSSGFLFRLHTISPTQRMHKDCPFYGNAETTDRLFPRPAPHLFHADTAYQENKVHIYVPCLMLSQTIWPPPADSPRFPIHTDTFYRCGIPDKCFLFCLPQQALPLETFHTTPVLSSCLLPQKYPVHTSFPCLPLHRHFPALPPLS